MTVKHVSRFLPEIVLKEGSLKEVLKKNYLLFNMSTLIVSFFSNFCWTKIRNNP